MIAELAAIVVLAVLLVVALLVLRRIRLLRRGGVDVALRPARATEDLRGWHSGLGRYRGNEFRWYRISGLSSGANVVLDRTRLEITDRRAPIDGEMHPDQRRRAHRLLLVARVHAAGTVDGLPAGELATHVQKPSRS